MAKKISKKSAFGAFKDIDIDKVIRNNDNSKKDDQKTIEEKESKTDRISNKSKSKIGEGGKVLKKNTSLSLDIPVFEIMALYCKISNITLSDIFNDYLKEKYIPENKVKEFVKAHVSNL